MPTLDVCKELNYWSAFEHVSGAAPAEWINSMIYWWQVILKSCLSKRAVLMILSKMDCWYVTLWGVFVCVPLRCHQKPLNRATHMTQKYSLPLSVSVSLHLSLSVFLTLKWEHCMWPIYSPKTSSGHYNTQIHTHTHITRCSRRTADRQQLSNWLSTAYYSSERQIGYRECPRTRKALIHSSNMAKISINSCLHAWNFEHSVFSSPGPIKSKFR